jgi:glycosyltransferase involved in cell wall biosynthesis
VTQEFSIVLPARDEAASLKALLPELRERCPVAEIIVVDDGSTDDTRAVCATNGVICVSHPYSMGNGAAVKTGARRASRDVIVFMDADGQHRPEDVVRLVDTLTEGFDMVVGARSAASQASLGRWAGNAVYNQLGAWMVGHRIDDLTSGFRAVRAGKFRKFLYLLPNGFSYPTTITMAFFRAGYTIAYVPIVARTRMGKSHLRIFKDGARFFLIIFRVGTLYSPLKLFVPISMAFLLMGCANYGYTYFSSGRFTNMSALLYVTSVLVFLIGLISEQITNLVYIRSNDDGG